MSRVDCFSAPHKIKGGVHFFGRVADLLQLPVQSTTASSDVEHFTGLISDFYELWCNIYSFIRLSIYAKLLSTKEFKCVIHRNAAADWLVFHVTSPKLLHVDGVGD